MTKLLNENVSTKTCHKPPIPRSLLALLCQYRDVSKAAADTFMIGCPMTFSRKKPGNQKQPYYNVVSGTIHFTVHLLSSHWAEVVHP
ncbi:MAG: hypothetical protein NOF05_01010 [Candidatus Accumulibacter phosphatis]|nr:hypothetical protein [Accumulibacter sp.]MBL8401020.1 hypothetical protein [Accumulibacter sp.]MCM8623406.1 hypothetical protein [Accumulibacter sp.]MCQ1547417.1 hypothetical protein [Candidatus Accumulibacter phosphatis]